MITLDEHLATLLKNAYVREVEVYQYQINIDNYSIMLTGLPQDEFPLELVQYKNTPTDELPHSLSDEDISSISQYQYRDRLRTLVRTEKIEQNKVRLLLESIKAQLTSNGMDYAVALEEEKARQTQAAATPPTT